jgi:hypothetical protein
MRIGRMCQYKRCKAAGCNEQFSQSAGARLRVIQFIPSSLCAYHSEPFIKYLFFMILYKLKGLSWERLWFF